MRSSDAPRIRSRNLRLDGTPLKTAEEIVSWHGAIQAQEYLPAQWSVAQRSSGLTSADLVGALAEGSILRTHALRPTWHFLALEDARLILGLTGPRVRSGLTSRYRELGLDPSTMARAQRVILKELSLGQHLTRRQLAERLRKSRIDISGQRLPHMLVHCELDQAICSGAPEGREHTYAAFDARVPAAKDLDTGEATRVLVEMYLRSHGPASVNDMQWWASLTASSVRTALDELDPTVQRAIINDVEVWWMGEVEAASSKPRVRLLETFDEFIVGYTRSRFLGDRHADVSVAAWRGRSPLRNLVTRGGAILGLWRRRRTNKTVSLEVRTYQPLSKAALTSLRSESARLASFMGLDMALDVRPVRGS